MYDFENRLILRTKANSSTINVSYDAYGNRRQKTVFNASAQLISSIYWLVDTNNLTGYAQVVEERVTTATDTTLRVFTHGISLISQATSLNTDPATLAYYTFDGHGNVRGLTDAAGTVTDRYDYDAFGKLIFQSGNTTNAYRYSGEQYDAELGMYYLRARYLNPDSGRFWSMDDYEGESGDPMSLHKYLYAHANPVSNIDPSGNMTLAQVQFTGATVVLVGAIALPQVRTAFANAVNAIGMMFTAAMSSAGAAGALAAENEAYDSNDLDKISSRAKELARTKNNLPVIFLHGGNLDEWVGPMNDVKGVGRGDFGPGFYTFRFPEGVSGAVTYAVGKSSGTSSLGFVSVFAMSQQHYEGLKKKRMSEPHDPIGDAVYDVLYGPLSGTMARFGDQYKFQGAGLGALSAGYCGTIPIANRTR